MRFTAGVIMWGMVIYGTWAAGEAVAQWVSSAEICAELQKYVGTSRAGHSLRSVSCSGSGRVFNIRVVID